MEVLPDVCWLEIIRELSKSNDSSERLYTLYNSCPAFFGRFLGDSRTTFLFPQVWTILEQKFRTDIHPIYDLDEDVDDDDDDDDDTINISDHVLHRLPRFQRSLKLRLVCKTWRDTFDDSFEDISRFYIENTLSGPHHNSNHAVFNSVLQECYHFDQRDRNYSNGFPALPHAVEHFYNHFQSTHSPDDNSPSLNPFIGRVLYLTCNFNWLPGLVQAFNPVAARFWGPIGIQRLLTQFGNHVHYCVLSISDYQIFDYGLYYQALANILQLLPNLKALSVTRKNQDRELSQDVSFPHIPSLSHITLLQTPPKLANYLLRANPQIEGLHIENLKRISDYCFFEIDLRKLQKLFICVAGDAGEVQKLNHPQVTWPLKSLHLKFERVHFIKWSHLFNLISGKWANSLTHLFLQLPKARGWQSQQLLYEELSSLKLELNEIVYLKLAISNFTSLDFLLPMQKTLQCLRVKTDFNISRAIASSADNKKIVDKQLIQLLGRETTNIFYSFPELKRAKVIESYRRNGIGPIVTTKWRFKRNKKQTEVGI